MNPGRRGRCLLRPRPDGTRRAGSPTTIARFCRRRDRPAEREEGNRRHRDRGLAMLDVVARRVADEERDARLVEESGQATCRREHRPLLAARLPLHQVRGCDPARWGRPARPCHRDWWSRGRLGSWSHPGVPDPGPPPDRPPPHEPWKFWYSTGIKLCAKPGIRPISFAYSWVPQPPAGPGHRSEVTGSEEDTRGSRVRGRGRRARP